MSAPPTPLPPTPLPLPPYPQPYPLSPLPPTQAPIPPAVSAPPPINLPTDLHAPAALERQITPGSKRVTEGLIAQEWLASSASQLTYYGLQQLHAQIGERELGRRKPLAPPLPPHHNPPHLPPLICPPPTHPLPTTPTTPPPRNPSPQSSSSATTTSARSRKRAATCTSSPPTLATRESRRSCGRGSTRSTEIR